MYCIEHDTTMTPDHEYFMHSDFSDDECFTSDDWDSDDWDSDDWDSDDSPTPYRNGVRMDA